MRIMRESEEKSAHFLEFFVRFRNIFNIFGKDGSKKRYLFRVLSMLWTLGELGIGFVLHNFVLRMSYRVIDS